MHKKNSCVGLVLGCSLYGLVVLLFLLNEMIRSSPALFEKKKSCYIMFLLWLSLMHCFPPYESIFSLHCGDVL